MKTTLLALLFTFIAGTTFGAEIDFRKVWCGYWVNPNDDARMWIWFNQSESGISATVERRAEDEENDPLQLYSATVKITKVGKKYVITGDEGFRLTIKTPIAKWNQGSMKGATLKIPSYGINTGIQCERRL